MKNPGPHKPKGFLEASSGGDAGGGAKLSRLGGSQVSGFVSCCFHISLGAILECDFLSLSHTRVQNSMSHHELLFSFFPFLLEGGGPFV